MTKKVKLVCRRCGSDDVSADATVRWNVDLQDWEISDVCGGEYCGACDFDTTLVEKEIEDGLPQ